MRKRYYHRKLIRDKIPKIMEANKDGYDMRTLGEAEFEKELKRKLIEEAAELADVLELVKYIAAYYKISFREVERQQKQKREKCGGFKKRLFLIWSTGKPGG